MPAPTRSASRVEVFCSPAHIAGNPRTDSPFWGERHARISDDARVAGSFTGPRAQRHRRQAPQLSRRSHPPPPLPEARNEAADQHARNLCRRTQPNAPPAPRRIPDIGEFPAVGQRAYQGRQSRRRDSMPT